MLGFGQLLFGAGALGTGAFDAAAEVSSDFRVLVVVDLELTPGREDERYVETDKDGLVDTINLDGTDSDADGLNRYARSRFENIVDLTNNGDTTVHELYFTLEVTDDGLEDGDPAPEEIEQTLQIVSSTDEIDATGDVDFFTITDDEAVEDGELEPGETVPFGIQVDLLPDSGPGSIGSLPDSDRFDVTLTIEANME